MADPARPDPARPDPPPPDPPPPDPPPPDPAVTVVVLTHDRAAECLETVARLRSLPDPLEVIVVDNASGDGTVARLRRCFPDVRVVESGANLGAAGRNLGVAAARTPYVALCDDDCWWEAGSLARGVRLLDAHPHVAALCARVLVGPDDVPDPTSLVMARSPLPAPVPLPGPALVGHLAGATIVRTRPFLEAGGYERRLFVGGEEELLTLDLLARGWWVCYVADLVVHHHPSPKRRPSERARALVRNQLWTTWLRLPARQAAARTWRLARRAVRSPTARRGLADAVLGAAWVLRRRAVVPAFVAEWVTQVDATT